MEGKYQCWFCGKSIDSKDGVDPCLIDIKSNIDLPEEKQIYQMVYCHIVCFKAVTHFPSLLRDGFKTE